jgi:hypothetical protein
MHGAAECDGTRAEDVFGAIGSYLKGYTFPMTAQENYSFTLRYAEFLLIQFAATHRHYIQPRPINC